jgi:UDP-sugar transporter A1/2/3
MERPARLHADPPFAHPLRPHPARFSQVVKDKSEGDVSIWVRNVQLGIFSVPQAAVLMGADHAMIAQHGALVGFTPLAWTVVALKALGGLLVAAVVKHADNVLKTYATAVSIVLTCAVTCISARVLPTASFVQGMTMVLVSVFLYNLGGSKPKPDPDAEASE